MNIGTCINPPRRGLNHGKYCRKITIPIISVASGHDVESMVGKPKRNRSKQREIIRQTVVQFLYHELELLEPPAYRPMVVGLWMTWLHQITEKSASGVLLFRYIRLDSILCEV
jgi:hypothetical protein